MTILIIFLIIIIITYILHVTNLDLELNLFSFVFLLPAITAKICRRISIPAVIDVETIINYTS